MVRSTSLARLRETGYTVPKGTVRITLTCGHTAIYVRPAPAPGTDAFCRVCDTWRRRKRERKLGRNVHPHAHRVDARPPVRRMLMRPTDGGR